MTTAAGNTRTTICCGKGSTIGSGGGQTAGRSARTARGGLRARTRMYPAGREPRKRRSDAPRQPHIRIGMEVLIVVPCDFRGCRGNGSFYHGMDSRFVGTIEQKRGPFWLVVTRLYGSFWATRGQMYVRDHNGRTWTTPLLVKNDPV